MNVILTGEKRVGKSTALARFLAAYPGRARGFRTCFSNDRALPHEKLIMAGLDGGNAACVVSWENGLPRPDLAAFDAQGDTLLSAPDADLLVMDELGKFEGGADGFRRAVERAFAGNVPVLAVVRLDTGGWMQALKDRADTAVVTVTPENRDAVPDMLAELLTK